MIEKGKNIIHDSRINRTVEYDQDNKQINVLDQRFYRRNTEYYPSVTSILNYFPKNKFFHSWLKDVGHNSEIIASKSANEGTQVHKAAEQLLLGQELTWMDDKGVANYNLEVWKMILKFADFWTKYEPELVATEYHLFSDNHKFAGTADIVCKLNGKLWLLDIKTSNSVHTEHNLQLSAYATAWNETHNEPVEEAGILWLKSTVRTEGKGDKIQGKGWELKSTGDIQNNFEMFMKIYDIYKLENPNAKPHTDSWPTIIKL